jgi:NAD(P)-dependent dehydrogenase (short-subunit alcohol dehydrogenase family)
MITGATGAIGGAAAAALAETGATVVLVARDEDRARRLMGRIPGGVDREVLTADLASPDAVRSLVSSFREARDELTGLVNCAALMTRERTVTPDGLELMFATNHLGPFLLTNLLLPVLRAGAPARILTLSAPSRVPVDLEDLQGDRRFRWARTFGATKTANLEFTFALARRLDPSQVTANALHPGLVKSALTDPMPAPVRGILRLVSADPSRAGRAIAELMTSPQVGGLTGRLFRGTRTIDPPRAATDPALQERLWEESARLVGRTEGA